jgi:hypothetical protein
MSVYIGTDTVKVARAGVNAQTAAFRDLLLSIGQRTGQILQVGSFGLSGSSYTEVNAQGFTVTGTKYDGTGFFGPFSRVPEVIGWPGFSNGLAYTGGKIVINPPSAPAFIDRYRVRDMQISGSSLFISVNPSIDVNDPVPVSFNYVIFRKPFAS